MPGRPAQRSLMSARAARHWLEPAVGFFRRGNARNRPASWAFRWHRHQSRLVRLENDSSVPLIRMTVMHDAGHHTVTAGRRRFHGCRQRPWPPENGDGQRRCQADERQPTQAVTRRQTCGRQRQVLRHGSDSRERRHGHGCRFRRHRPPSSGRSRRRERSPWSGNAGPNDWRWDAP